MRVGRVPRRVCVPSPLSVLSDVGPPRVAVLARCDCTAAANRWQVVRRTGDTGILTRVDDAALPVPAVCHHEPRRRDSP
jgi:hypothetical protein